MRSVRPRRTARSGTRSRTRGRRSRGSRSRTTAATHAAHTAGAHNDRLVEQAAGERGLDEGADGTAAGALAEDHHVIGIAAELGDILLDPLQALDHVQDTVVTGNAVRALGGKLRMSEEAEDAETVVDGHEDDAVRGELLTVELGLGAPAFAIAAAMDPVSDREFRVGLAGSGGPDIEVQAVLAEGSLFTVAPLEGVTTGIVHGLEARMTETVANLHAVPRNDGLRSFPTEIAERRSGIRDALVSGNTGNVGSDTLHLSTFDG